MERAQIEEWLERYGRLAEQEPDRYEAAIKRWIGLSAWFYVAAAVATLALFAFMYWLFFESATGRGSLYVGFIACVLAYSLIRSLFVKVDVPKGLPVSRSEQPRLWQKCDEIAEKIDAPKPTNLMLDQEPNASAFASSGGAINVLMGAPLAMMQTEEEFLSVVAHELAHHKRGDTSISLKAGRVHARWERLLISSGAGGISQLPIYWFAQWYLPRLALVTLAGRRKAEYEADRTEILATSRETAADSLMRMNLVARTRLDGFQASSARDRLKQMGEAMRGDALKAPEAVLDSLMRETTVIDSSHPALPDRLRSLGVPATTEHWMPRVEELSKAAVRPASETLFENWESLEQKIPSSDEEIAEYIAADEALKGTLETGPKRETLGHAIVYANLLGLSNRPGDARAALEEAHKKWPDNENLTRALGLARAYAGDVSGLEMLRELAQDYALGRPAVLEAEIALAQRSGDTMRAYELKWEMEKVVENINQAWQHFLNVSRADWQPSSLPPEVRADLADWARKEKRFAKAIPVRSPEPEAEHRTLEVLLLIHTKGFLDDGTDPSDISERADSVIPDAPHIVVAWSVPGHMKKFPAISREELLQE